MSEAHLATAGAGVGRSVRPAAAGAAGAWATWPAAVALIVGVSVARVAYLIWLSPWELAGDEAYYWECSRHLSACYYEKGPGLPWLIAACCRLFGDHEWAIRLPVALSSAGAAWVVGRLAISAAGGDARAGFVAVAVFLLVPAFQANAQICTQDGPMILLWAGLTAAGLSAVRRWEGAGLRVVDSAGFGALLGLAFLFKQSALLFVPGAALYVVIRRRELRWSRGLIGHAALALAAFVAVVSPMIVWNVQHGWPTLGHTLGHLGAPGGDLAEGKGGGGFTLEWPAKLVGAQLGAVGLPALFAMGGACAWAWRAGRADGEQWAARLWLICCAVPAVVFFVALSFTKEVLGSWPFPSYVPLVALVGVMACAPRSAVARGRGRAWLGWAVVAYGLGAWVVLSFPDVLARVPVAGPVLERVVMKRVSGHREKAARVQRLIEAGRDEAGRPPLVIARYYMDAALDAFYLPGRPRVYNAGTLTGQRSTSYDYWADNDLSDPALRGRDAVLDGAPTARPWPEVLRLESVAPVAGTKMFVARGFGGVR